MKTSILLALVVAAQNLNQLTLWSHRTNDARDPVATMDIAGHGFVEVDEHGDVLRDGPPPLPVAA